MVEDVGEDKRGLVEFLQLGVGIFAGGVLNWLFARRSSTNSGESRREAERLRELTLKLIQLLDGANVIEVKEWDPETGEPSRWRVVKTIELLWNVEPPTVRREQLRKTESGG